MKNGKDEPLVFKCIVKIREQKGRKKVGEKRKGEEGRKIRSVVFGKCFGKIFERKQS